MKAKIAIWILAGACVLTAVGCSSIDARINARDTKFYPGVRNFSAGAGPGADPLFAGFAPLDFVLSAVTDTISCRDSW